MNTFLEISDAMRVLLLRPELQQYLRVIELLRAGGFYAPRSVAIEDMEALLDQRKFQAVIETYNSANPNYVLDPHAYLLVARAHSCVGDGNLAAVFNANARAVCDAIKTTGDGSLERPYRVTHLSSARGFVEVLFGARASAERMRCEDSLRLLGLAYKGEMEVWFDVTAATEPSVAVFGQGVTIQETSAAGEQIIRHSAGAVSRVTPTPDAELQTGIVAHVGKHIARPANVIHEGAAPTVHIDILVSPPAPERNWLTLVTSGMSVLPMNPPGPAADCRFAELMICLPPDWRLDEEALSHEEHYWPLRWLRQLAQATHQHKTWLGYGHTIPNGEAAEAFAFNTRLCGLLIMLPRTTPESFASLELGSRRIHFLALVPLYREEMELKLKFGARALLNALNESGVDELLNLRRKNVAAML